FVPQGYELSTKPPFLQHILLKTSILSKWWYAKRCGELYPKTIRIVSGYYQLIGLLSERAIRPILRKSGHPYCSFLNVYSNSNCRHAFSELEGHYSLTPARMLRLGT